MLSVSPIYDITPNPLKQGSKTAERHSAKKVLGVASTLNWMPRDQKMSSVLLCAPPRSFKLLALLFRA